MVSSVVSKRSRDWRSVPLVAFCPPCPTVRHADPIRDRHLAKLREKRTRLVDAISERTGLAKRTVLQRLAQVMKKTGTIFRSGIQVR